MANLELLKASVVSPIIATLRSRGTDVTPHLAKARLPLIMAERQVGLVPWVSALRFLDGVAHYTGDPLFSADCILRAGGKRPNTVASITLVRAPTAYESIRVFVKQANTFTTGSTITTTVSGNWLWILRRPNSPGNIVSWHTEQFVIALFVKAISSFLGEDWRPQKLKIRQATRPDYIPWQWTDADIETANPYTAIGVELGDIVSETKCNYEHTAPPGDWDQAALREAVANDSASLRSAVLHYIEHETGRITRVADAFGVTERTLRRHLNAAGLSYSELVDETRYKRALELLKDSSLSITELALSLGYRYPENFTRAFRKRVGVSPNDYRKMTTKGRGQDTFSCGDASEPVIKPCGKT